MWAYKIQSKKGEDIELDFKKTFGEIDSKQTQDYSLYF